MRRILLSAFASLSLLASPAMAEGIPLHGQSQFSGANVVSGDYNYAQQRLVGVQPGPVLPYQPYSPATPPKGPFGISSFGVGANIVSGTGNVARQDATIVQGFPSMGGGLLHSGVATGLNLVTGMGNLADQSLFIGQQ